MRPPQSNRPTTQLLRPNEPEGNFICYEHSHTPDFEMPLHSHGLAQIICVLDGAGQFVTRRGALSVRTGDVIVVPPDTPHTVVSDPEHLLANFVITLCPSILSVPRRVLFALLSEPFVMTPNEDEDKAVRSLIRRIQHEERTRRAHSATAVRLLVDQLFLDIYRWKMADDPAVRPDVTTQDEIEWLIEYLHTHYSQPVSLEKLAAQIGVSARHLRTLFKKATGTTVVRYLNRVRMEKAMDLLVTTELSVTEICYRVGFNNLSYFTRLFSEHARMPPTEYRKASPLTRGGAAIVGGSTLFGAFRNVDFYDDFNDGLTRWRTFHPFGSHVTTVTLDTETFRSGSQSLYCESPSPSYLTAAHRDFPITGPSTYRFLATVKVADLELGPKYHSSVMARLLFRNRHGKQLANNLHLFVPMTEEDDWIEMNHVFAVVPGVEVIRLELMIYHAAAKVWWDRVALVSEDRIV